MRSSEALMGLGIHDTSNLLKLHLWWEARSRKALLLKAISVLVIIPTSLFLNFFELYFRFLEFIRLKLCTLTMVDPGTTIQSLQKLRCLPEHGWCTR